MKNLPTQAVTTKKFSNEKIKLGFTLAEVLVTLGIIGVVSAMTIPTLTKNHQRQVLTTQLHKVYNEIANALEIYQNERNAVNLAETPLRNSAAGLHAFFENNFKIVKDCNGSHIGCFNDEYKSLDGSKTTRLRGNKCNVTVVLANGAAICADTEHEEDTTGTDEDGNDYSISNSNVVGQAGSIIAFEVDVNGKDGPNIFGRDYFAFQVDRNGNIFDKDYNAETNQIDPSDGYPETGAFGKIVNDGWKMTY